MASLMPHSQTIAARELGDALEIVAGAGRELAVGDLFGDAAAEQNRESDRCR